MRSWTADDLPGIGDYREIHWQIRDPGNPCSWVPGPTDWEYRGIVLLQPEDAAALAARYEWAPVTPEQQYSEQLDGQYRGSLYLDPDNTVAFFSVFQLQRVPALRGLRVAPDLPRLCARWAEGVGAQPGQVWSNSVVCPPGGNAVRGGGPDRPPPRRTTGTRRYRARETST